MNIKAIVVDMKSTIGEKPLLIETRPFYGYKDGIKGEQEGITITVLSENAGYEKVDIKLPGLMTLP